MRLKKTLLQELQDTERVKSASTVQTVSPLIYFLGSEHHLQIAFLLFFQCWPTLPGTTSPGYIPGKKKIISKTCIVILKNSVILAPFDQGIIPFNKGQY